MQLIKQTVSRDIEIMIKNGELMREEAVELHKKCMDGIKIAEEAIKFREATYEKAKTPFVTYLEGESLCIVELKGLNAHDELYKEIEEIIVKHIPQKIIRGRIFVSSYGGYEDGYMCPTCNETFRKGRGRRKHCHECGQHLDWSV